MHYLKYFYNKTLNYELTNKFTYNNTKELPKLKKIVLNFGCKTTYMKRIASSLLALELITYQKGKITTTKYSNIMLKLRKGNPVGCTVELRNKKMYYFLEKLLVEIIPKIKNFTGLKFNNKLNDNCVLSYKLQDNFVFKTIEEHYYLFNSLPRLNITITATTNNKKEFNFMIKSFQFPLSN